MNIEMLNFFFGMGTLIGAAFIFGVLVGIVLYHVARR